MSVDDDDSPTTAQILVPADESWWLLPFVDLTRTANGFIPGTIAVYRTSDCSTLGMWSVDAGNYSITVDDGDARLESSRFNRTDANDEEPSPPPHPCPEAPDRATAAPSTP
jgi:hypothetical protein